MVMNYFLAVFAVKRLTILSKPNIAIKMLNNRVGTNYITSQTVLRWLSLSSCSIPLLGYQEFACGPQLLVKELYPLVFGQIHLSKSNVELVELGIGKVPVNTRDFKGV